MVAVGGRAVSAEGDEERAGDGPHVRDAAGRRRTAPAAARGAHRGRVQDDPRRAEPATDGRPSNADHRRSLLRPGGHRGRRTGHPNRGIDFKIVS